MRSVIITIPCGLVSTMTKGSAFPKKAIPGIIISSLFVIGRRSIFFLMMTSIPMPNSIRWPSGINGARATSRASFTSARLIFTRSPSPVPAFFLVRLSIRTRRFPSSEGCARHTDVAVTLVPSSSITSPIERSRSIRV